MISILALQNQKNLALSAYVNSVKPFAQGQAWGKVMLFGEYAVLNGGPALLTATPQQAKADYLDLSHLAQILQIDLSLTRELQESNVSPNQIEYVICAFNWGNSVIYTNRQGDLKRLGESFAFIERCLHEACAPKGIYFIDTQEFGLSIHGQWQKIGIGSSGASSAALCSLISQFPESL
jgi:mevalonate kinase